MIAKANVRGKEKTKTKAKIKNDTNRNKIKVYRRNQKFQKNQVYNYRKLSWQ